MISSGQNGVEEVLARHTDRLMDLPGVVGTALGICQDKPGIIVFVVEETQDLKVAIPASLDGVPVCLAAIGEVRALPDDKRKGP